MGKTSFSIETLWQAVGFTPNPAQRNAILHVDGPLYLPAGPGSGKTRVLLWRTLNLIVFYDVAPEEVFLSTFTEKAALQLQDGLRALLGQATHFSGVPYDVSKMYVGTVHSLCQRLIADRRFTPNRQRARIPALMDQLGQYFYLSRRRNWARFTAAAGFDDESMAAINSYFNGYASLSRHTAVQNCIGLFNRLSEECIEPAAVYDRVDEAVLGQLIKMYDSYKKELVNGQALPRTDFALLQQRALATLAGYPQAGSVFKQVIVDEYQDTNTIQEKLFFELAAGWKNICVVGDDDQALYRFRGATVENFVEFPRRCQDKLGLSPHKITLATNYRSRQKIVSFYTGFIDQCDWRKQGAAGFYRVVDKDIHAHNTDKGPAVLASTAGKPDLVCAEIAGLVRRLLDEGKVADPNQVAFLFPSLKSPHVGRMKQALENEGLLVYAPRAGRFLEVDEPAALFGILLHVFGRPERGDVPGRDYKVFHDWLDGAYATGEALLAADPALGQYVQDLRREIELALADYVALLGVVEQNGWDLTAAYDIERMKKPLQQAPGLSSHARRVIGNAYFENVVRLRREEGQPFPLNYVINRATSLDWNVLDLFYRICGFEHFKGMFDLAQSGKDEGPICNLGLISQYLSRFMDEYTPIITAELLAGDKFQRWFFSSYLYALFRLGEAEYEDAEDPFPRGRIPFLTIHQAKGLEFPVVVLGNLRKDNRGPQRVEKIVHPLLDREGEPLDRSAEFDIMRMFYVALSRAKNLLVLAHYTGPGQSINKSFKEMLANGVPRIPDFNPGSVPPATVDETDLPRNYSYTGEYLLYRKCPRQYMIFRKYGFVPSRSQTMFFGSLVHRTLEDLHQFLIARRQQA